ncbi:2-dehydropantoate 2-reductase N-terminal domain-containing protein [Sorangium sp. So ce281]|uniref:ketopantoate reductase family protein n=2 Tax=unclassified Sorangium TaxID=2621164 RepID=UPI003F5FC4C0
MDLEQHTTIVPVHGTTVPSRRIVVHAKRVCTSAKPPWCGAGYAVSMKMAVLGTGAIGSTFAYQLVNAGHEVTAVARGARLERLREDRAIVLSDGARAPVAVAGTLDPSVSYDLVLVTVLAPQVDSVLPALRQSAARHIMFMFNTFEPLDRLRDAVGAERFSFGFPGGVLAHLIDGKLRRRILPGTTVGDAAWAEVFGAAGIPTVTSADMHGWLRSHAAMVIPLMSIGVVVAHRNAGITWREARRYAAALAQGFHIVRGLGHALEPTVVALLSRLPRTLTTGLLWLMSRTQELRNLGALGAAEPRMLIDMMATAVPNEAAELLAIRP